MPDWDREQEIKTVEKETQEAIKEWSFTLRGVIDRMDKLSKKLDSYPTLANTLIKARDELTPSRNPNGDLL